MSLFDLCRLVRHYWKLIACVTAGFAAVVILVFALLIPQRYQAAATITVSDPSGNVGATTLLAVVNSLAMSEADRLNANDPTSQATIALGPSGKPQTLIITVEAPAEDYCVEKANELAGAVVSQAEQVFQELEVANQAKRADLSALNSAEDVAGVLSGSLLQDILGSDLTFEFCSFRISEAQQAVRAGLGGLSLIGIGLLGGALVALAIVIAIYFSKKPIMGSDGIEQASQLPVLNGTDRENWGAFLWVNVQLAAGIPLGSICLAPLSADTAQICASELKAAIEETGALANFAGEKAHAGNDTQNTVVRVCAPVFEGIDTVLTARGSSATVICARMWTDSLPALIRSVEELKLGNANVVGVALLPQDAQ